MNRQSPKIAIVCDFLCTMGGAENVVLALHEAFPEAPIYTAIYEESKVPAFKNIDIANRIKNGIKISDLIDLLSDSHKPLFLPSPSQSQANIF